MELTMSDTVLLAMAVRAMLEKDLTQADRTGYEKLWYKLKMSHKGKRIRELFNDTTPRNLGIYWEKEE